MIFKEDLFYTDQHYWLKVYDDDVAYLGYTEFIQLEFGKINFIELPKIGYHYKKGEICGYIDTKNGYRDIVTPVTGVIERINEDLDNQPCLINSSPYENGWLFRFIISDKSEFDSFYKAEDYHLMVSSDK